MFMAVRFMESEINAIAELVGPFDTAEDAFKYADTFWGELNSDEFDIFPVTTPTNTPPKEQLAVMVDYEPTCKTKESDDDKAPF